MKRLSPNAYFLIVVLLVMGVFFVTSLGYTSLKVKLMPLIMSGATIALSAIALVADIRSGSKKSMPTDDDGDVVEDDDKKGTPLSAYFKAFGWVAALIASVYILGFILSIPLWMTVYLWKHGFRLWTGVAQGLGFTVVVYVLFTVVLQVTLYQGAVGALLFKQLGL